jgi:Holliday junction resolvase RusA-like endonuclease
VANRSSITLGHLGPAAREQAVQKLAEQNLSAMRPRSPMSTPSPALGPEHFTLTLPMPPSTNHLFSSATKTAKDGRQYSGRVKSQVYRQWIAAAVAEIRHQKAPHFAGPIKIDVACERKSPLSDIDNRLKSTLDALVAAHVLIDDRQVIEVRAWWANVKGCVVDIVSADETINIIDRVIERSS